jgi:integrase/recombinase XerD
MTGHPSRSRNQNEYKELQAFFAVCTKDERLIFQFFLYTGMRDKDVAYTTWRSVNFTQGTISVRSNPKYEWTTKRYKGREIPVPHSLMDALKAAKNPPMLAMIFRSLLTVGKPKFFVAGCKDIAERAGLNREDWWLHKFRATFATMYLWAGVDLRTVMSWGHSSMTSTMR